MPSADQIQPIEWDPLLAGIRTAKEAGKNFSQIPNPVLQLIGDAMVTMANQHESLHLSFMGLLKARNFVEQGGVQALSHEIENMVPPALKDGLQQVQQVQQPPEAPEAEVPPMPTVD